MSSAAVEVIDRGVSRALHALRSDLENLEDGWQRVGDLAVAEVSAFVPVESGALVDDLRAEVEPLGLRIVVGEGVPYAGVINYGWPARNISGADFMTKAGPAIENEAPEQLAQEIQHAIDVLGLH